MNVPDLARRAALNEQRQAQAQAADNGLWLKIAVDCYVHCSNGVPTQAEAAQQAFSAADAFMAEYKKRREDAS